MKDLFETKIGPLPPTIQEAEAELVRDLEQLRDSFCQEVCEQHGQCMAKKHGSQPVARGLAEALADDYITAILENYSQSLSGGETDSSDPEQPIPPTAL